MKRILEVVVSAALAGGVLSSSATASSAADDGLVEAVLNEYLRESGERADSGQTFDDTFCRLWSARLRGAMSNTPVDRWHYSSWIVVGALEGSLEDWGQALDAWRHARATAPSWDEWFQRASDEYVALRQMRDSATDDDTRGNLDVAMRGVVAGLADELVDPGRRLEVISSLELSRRYLWLLHEEYRRLGRANDYLGAAEHAESEAIFATSIPSHIRDDLLGWDPDDCYERAASAFARAGQIEDTVRCVHAAEGVQSPRMPASFHVLNVFQSIQGVNDARSFMESWTANRVGDENAPELVLRYHALIRSVPLDIRGEYAEPLIPFVSSMLNDPSVSLALADARYVADQARAGITVSGWRRSYYSSSALAILAKACHLVNDDDQAFNAATDLLARYPDHPACPWAMGIVAHPSD